jgi:hypothetical protein
MEAEHCSKAGCNETFETPNYHVTTTPSKEWGIVIYRNFGSDLDLRYGRRIPVIQDLLLLPVSFALFSALEGRCFELSDFSRLPRLPYSRQKKS